MIVGLTGPAGCGKDTVGDILVEHFDFAKVSFAHPIKKMICEGLLNVPMSKWDDREWRETPLPVINQTPRYLAQTLGTEWGREIVKDTLWLDLTIETIAKEVPMFDAVITDVRFDNEAERIRAYGGVVVHIKRDDRDVGFKHASESGVKPQPGDCKLDNNGDLSDLLTEVFLFAERRL